MLFRYHKDTEMRKFAKRHGLNMNTAKILENLEQLVGQKVTFSSDDVSFEADVQQLDRLPQHGDDAHQPFSVIFLAENPEPFEQQTYSMTHSQIDELLIFLVPIGPGDGGMRYEAVFN